MILLQLAVLALLFAGYAFFSLSESALTALSALRMKRLSVLRPALSPYFSEWLSRPHRLLVTLMIGSNVLSLAVSSLAAALALPLRARLPAKLVDLGVWILVTAALLVFAEMVPKIVGRVYRERVSEWALPVLSRVSRAFALLAAPVGWAMERLAPGMETAPVGRLSTLSLEELQHVIVESQAAGQMPAESGEMMKRVLSLTQRPVSAVLQPAEKVDAVPLETFGRPNGAELFVDLLVETGRTRVPVTRAGAPAGYVNVLDLFGEGVADAGRVESLTRRPLMVPPDKGVFDLLGDFQKSGEPVAFVQDGQEGRFLGIVTLEDVLEEIVGEILDEYDLEQKKP